MSRSLPQARVVRKGGVLVAPPPVPLRERLQRFEEGLGPSARGFLAALIGLWPVTAVMLLSLVLAYITMMSSSP